MQREYTLPADIEPRNLFWWLFTTQLVLMVTAVLAFELARHAGQPYDAFRGIISGVGAGTATVAVLTYLETGAIKVSIYIADFLREAHERRVNRKIREAAEAAAAEATEKSNAEFWRWWNRRQNSLARGIEFDEEPPIPKEPEPEEELDEEIDVSELTERERRMFLAGLRQGIRDRRAEQFEMKLLERARNGNGQGIHKDKQDRAG